MEKLKIFLYWAAIIPAFWYYSLWSLFFMSPISDDGYGLSATFFWGKPPHSFPQFHYPYWIAASIITFLACGLTTWLLRYWKPKQSRLFVFSVATTFVLLLLLATVSDIRIRWRIWYGTLTLTTHYSAYVFLKTMIPLSLVAGLLHVGRSKLARQ